MKIMHIVQAPGGVERYIGMYLENSNGKSIKNIIIASYDYDYKKYADRVYAFENVEMCREISIVRDMKSIIEVRKCIKKYKPDIIYCHSSKAGAIGRIANI